MELLNVVKLGRCLNIVNDCPQTELDVGLQKLHLAEQQQQLKWILVLVFGIVVFVSHC